MGYQVNKRAKKDGTIYWRLIFREIKGNENHDKHIPVSQYTQHGFVPSMSVDEARARAKQLNAQNRLDKQAQKAKLRALERAKADELLKSAHLPAELAREFETDYMRKRFAVGPNTAAKYKKAHTHWQYVKRIIVELNLDPRFWADEAHIFYEYVSRKKCSPAYVSKIPRVLNPWGFFMSRKLDRAFAPIPTPTGYHREMIRYAYLASKKKKMISAPLTPAVLNKAQAKLIPSQLNWLYLSLWFGLRPKEIDSFCTKGHFEIENGKSGVPVIWVYQSKLTAVKQERRSKPIPCIFPEQLAGLETIQSGNFHRPLVKTIKKHISEDINLYGGRKGFSDLIRSKGQRLEDIASWMGHATIERTWRSHKDKQKARFTLPKRKAS